MINIEQRFNMIYYQGYRQNKFKNKRTEFQGRLYASKLESSCAANLELARSATNKKDRVVEVIPQYPIDIFLNGLYITDKAIPNKTVKLFRYYCDFWVKFADGHEELQEAKGMVTDLWRLKWKITEQLYNKKYPETVLRVIK